MGTASLHFDAWNMAWRSLREKLAPPCGDRDCTRGQTLWGRLRAHSHTVVIQGLRYCHDECMERALLGALCRLRSGARQSPVPHRVPLGLLLLSRQQLTVEQLRTALEAQRSAGYGRIGEWLQTLGFASELQVTAALARQWSCPVLRTSSVSPGANRVAQIPLSLLESCVMIPVDYIESTATLHVAFGAGIDYRVLYAIEQMTACHTESCMVIPSFVRQNLQALSARRAESEVVFERVSEDAELSRIIRSYCVRLSASEIRLAVCGPSFWVRLLGPARPSLDLLFPVPLELRACSFAVSPVLSAP